jgi:hypothetical protein
MTLPCRLSFQPFGRNTSRFKAARQWEQLRDAQVPGSRVACVLATFSPGSGDRARCWVIFTQRRAAAGAMRGQSCAAWRSWRATPVRREGGRLSQGTDGGAGRQGQGLTRSDVDL